MDPRISYATKTIKINVLFGIIHDSCRKIFRELRVLTLPCLYILKILLFILKYFEKFIINNFYHNYVTRRAHELYLPLHTLAVTQKGPIYVGVKLYKTLAKYIKDKSSSLLTRKV